MTLRSSYEIAAEAWARDVEKQLVHLALEIASAPVTVPGEETESVTVSNLLSLGTAREKPDYTNYGESTNMNQRYSQKLKSAFKKLPVVRGTRAPVYTPHISHNALLYSLLTLRIQQHLVASTRTSHSFYRVHQSYATAYVVPFGRAVS